MSNFNLFHFDLSVLLPAAWRRRRTVLIVDDDSTTAQLIGRGAEAEGFAVVFATTAEQADGILNENGRKFALVMLDVRLPSMDGWRLRTRLLAKYPRLRICMMSASSESFRDAPAGELVLVLEKPSTYFGVFRELKRGF